jgi:hypothetical protein
MLKYYSKQGNNYKQYYYNECMKLFNFTTKGIKPRYQQMIKKIIHYNHGRTPKHHPANKKPFEKPITLRQKNAKTTRKNISKDEKSTHNPDNTIADSLQ